MVWGRYYGREKLKIGELAEITGITKRTIDYYTNLGLLTAERSPSNYRYYSIDMVERIKEIEEKKQQGLTLEEIKKTIIDQDTEEVDIQKLRLHFQLLEKDVSQLVKQLNHSDLKKQQFIKEKISKDSVALMQSLLLLLKI